MAIVMNASVELEVFGSNLFVACLTSLRVGSRLSHISMMGENPKNQPKSRKMGTERGREREGEGGRGRSNNNNREEKEGRGSEREGM